MDIKKDLQKLWEGRKGPYQKLCQLEFNEQGMRGVKNISLDINYPITAVAGTNGIGKTTILQVMACLFHNTNDSFQPYRFSNSKVQHINYRFTDFFVIARGEDKGLGAEIKYRFEKPGSARSEFSVKKISRWTNYERRPDRIVDFLGISRVLPAHEFGTMRNVFASNYTILTSEELAENEKRTVSKITGKNLSSIIEDSCSTVQNFKLSKVSNTEGIVYSSFNMGAGEEVAITLVKRISSLPEGSLVLIEEIELGLHPRAQKELVLSLMNIVLEKRIQLIFTTHSPYVFDILPPQAKVLLRKPSNSLEVIYEPSNSIAFIELIGGNQKDLTIYVEDEIAKQIIENLFNATVSKRIHILDVGSDENVIRLTSAHYVNPNLGPSIGIPDGDVNDSKIKSGCKKYMLRNEEECTEEEFSLRKRNYFSKLPTDLAPEKYILSKIKEEDDFLEDIDDSAEFRNYIHNEIDISNDHHALFYKIADFLSKEENGVKRDILRYVAKKYRDDFQDIINLVNEKLNI